MKASEIEKGKRVQCLCDCHWRVFGSVVTPDLQAGRTSVYLDDGTLIFLPFSLLDPAITETIS